jgi:hypothetical protein
VPSKYVYSLHNKQFYLVGDRLLLLRDCAPYVVMFMNVCFIAVAMM